MILLSVFCFLGGIQESLADSKRWDSHWSNRHNAYVAQKKYNYYLDNERHLQIPQWDHKEWYAEDWIAQKENAEALIEDFYKADILWDQIIKTNRKDEETYPILVVGPNFYRLSGYDKRRVSHIVDIVYAVTKNKDAGYFMLQDWHTHLPIGIFDKEGLRLH